MAILRLLCDASPTAFYARRSATVKRTFTYDVDLRFTCPASRRIVGSDVVRGAREAAHLKENQ